jgi:hypothetical protein
MRALLAFVACIIGLALAAPIVVVGAPFWFVSWCMRSVQRWIEPHTIHWKDLIQFDPLIGWKPKPSMRGFCAAEGADIFYVETDEDGWCGPSSLEQSAVVVFGDSYAFGYAANHPFFRVSPSELPIKAVGAPGYSMVQELLLINQLAARLRGKLVVWFIYPGNDLTDNLSPAMTTWGYRMPFLQWSDKDASWNIFTNHVQPDKWLAGARYDRNRKISAVFGKNRLSDRTYAACEYLIARGEAICRHGGADLVVLTIPWTIQFDPLPWPGVSDTTVEPDLPERRIGAICAKLGVKFVSGVQHLNGGHYIPHEGHLNNDGHRQLAMILKGLYRQHRCPVQDSSWSQSVPIFEQA